MSKYGTELAEDNGNFTWVVMEKDTNLAVWGYSFEQDASKTAKFLTGGGGFNGFTPPFFLVDAPCFRKPSSDTSKRKPNGSKPKVVSQSSLIETA